MTLILSGLLLLSAGAGLWSLSLLPEILSENKESNSLKSARVICLTMQIFSILAASFLIMHQGICLLD